MYHRPVGALDDLGVFQLPLELPPRVVAHAHVLAFPVDLNVESGTNECLKYTKLEESPTIRLVDCSTAS